jgi:broad specificity phosphatase PhoE
MTRLILIRHSETDYNLLNRYCGFSNPPLNNKGIWQSKRLAARLRDVNIDKVYSSDLKRAVETAKIVFKDNLIETEVDLREMNFGILEGLRYEEVIKKYPTVYRYWIDNPEKVRIPNGEGLEDLTRRVTKKLSLFFSQHKNKTIAVITHGGPIRVILCNVLKCGLEKFWQIEQEICALNIIDYSEKMEPVVIKVNDISHLFVKENRLWDLCDFPQTLPNALKLSPRILGHFMRRD